MKSIQIFHLVILVTLTTTSTAVPNYAKIGCKDRCGKVRIPYPFGIGPKCSLNKWYVVDCNFSTPYLSALNYLEVLGVNLENQTVTINMPRISDCQNPVSNRSQNFSVDLGRSPFLFSKSHNKFVVEGCGNVVISDHGSVLAGCSATCHNNTVSDKNNCFGIGCCQTTIPHYLKSYSMNLTGLERQSGDGGCGSAFLVDENSYIEGRFSGQSVVGDNSSFVPISLLWTLSDRDFNNVREASYMLDSDFRTLKLDMGNGTSMRSWKLSCWIDLSQGNPYLLYGCVESEECKTCEKSGGYCSYDRIYDADGLISE